MKKYRQLIKELPSKKVVFAFGRFQPPTTGHELLVNAVKKIASKQKADHVIFASRTHDKKSNPLPVDRKVYYLKRMFPKTNFIAANEEIRTFMEAAAALSKKYKNLVMIAGSDRVPEYKKLLEKYNGTTFTFDTIEVVSAGERDPDADSASGMSGTKMREAAKAGNYSLFKKGLPHTLTDLDGKRLMNEIRQGLGMDIVKEQIKFETDDIREKYFAGEIFNIGEIVESNEVVYTIVKRGSNHLLLQDEVGNVVSKWPQDVTPSDKPFNPQQELQEMKFSPADKIKVARIIASSLGVVDAEEKSGAETMVNTALRSIKNKRLTPEAWKIIANMLNMAKDAGIKYDEKIVATFVKEDTVEEELQTPEEDLEQSELSDEEIEKMIGDLKEDDYLEAYDDEEFGIVDEETGEYVDELKEDVILEVLSRAERIKAKTRFARTQAKRERRTRIALKSRSNSKTINKRARRMAINMMKTRLTKKAPGTLTTGEKERVERMIAKRKVAIDRIAMKMVPRVRKIENDRLVHKSYTK